MNYAEYTTVYDVRTTERGSGTTDTGQDTYFLELIRSTSAEMEAACAGRRFVPVRETRYFDMPGGAEIELEDNDLLEVTTVTNGEGTAIAGTAYRLHPYNVTPYYKLELKYSSGIVWLPDSSGEWQRVIAVAGVWGYHRDYASAWLDTTATLSVAITVAGSTSFTCTTGKIKAGQLLKIDSEYFYASSVATGATDTVTCVPAVNGSTAATHLISAPIYRWYYPEIEKVCRQAVNAYERLKNNPVGETVSMDGQTFTTPKDVQKWIGNQMAGLGLTRTH